MSGGGWSAAPAAGGWAAPAHAEPGVIVDEHAHHDDPAYDDADPLDAPPAPGTDTLDAGEEILEESTDIGSVDRHRP